MNAATFRIVLLVSFAHALVHAFEVALPSVEQMIGADFHVEKEQTGLLGTVWRIPFGCGALLAGWLADRFGSKPLLIIFLAGSIGAALVSSLAPSLEVVFLAMFAMGCFASIYHPAGLAIISRETRAENRPAALGWHGIFGSVGFTCAPLLAALAFSTAAISWRQYYVVLCVPAVLTAVLLAVVLREDRSGEDLDHRGLPKTEEPPAPIPGTFYYLVMIGALSGFVYAGFLHFLPRYMDTALVAQTAVPAEGVRNYLAAIVLAFAVIGQAIAGRLARPGWMERQLSLVLFASVPCLAWMAVADGIWRLVAACLFALIHFMNQPIYNSLIAQYVPSARRSTGYGFSNMICFGLGALGPWFAGFVKTDALTYGSLAGVLFMAALLAWFLAPGEREA